MVEALYKIVWTRRSQKQMKQLYEYISEDSSQNAAKVIDGILDAVHRAAPNPEIYGSDKFKSDNDGTYRAFETHRYRVAYRFTDNTIRVLRVRHTSMEPKPY